jgi:hypothetical protein
LNTNGAPVSYLELPEGAVLASEIDNPAIFGPFDFSEGCPDCHGKEFDFVDYQPQRRSFTWIGGKDLPFEDPPIKVGWEVSPDYDGSRDARIECRNCLSIFPVREGIDFRVEEFEG